MNLLPYIYQQMLQICSNCLAYRFAENRILYIVYEQGSVEDIRTSMLQHFATADKAAFKMSSGQPMSP